MGFDSLSFYVPAMFVTVGSMVIGGLFVLVAWTNVINDPTMKRNLEPQKGVYAFTASVALDVITIPIVRALPYEWEHDTVLGIPYIECIWSLLLIAGIVCLVMSMVLVRGRSGPGLVAVKVGSKVLSAIVVIGLIGLVYLAPGMPWD
jgi:hypothetical protein